MLWRLKLLWKSTALAASLLADWKCYTYHRSDLSLMTSEGHLCGCGREWAGMLCISRNWKHDMEVLADEVGGQL